MMSPGGFGWMMGFGGLGMVLVWLVLIVLVVWAVSQVFRGTNGGTREDALDILKRRYASGEITQAEFETARRALAA
jgi:putative membrane protein